ncbi:branched-chain amino acid ABC transporter permease [Maridesulfovibrio ferrireducens]|uniref:Branched-chain amino acid transport system permease protein n=1 Tax=Maridesulfovibrio ferrireducens TaxID=246191 RepID=A0A1G9FLZ2_9BACT|nr:branched-chain amino acid ABC transporter permease [Maridesulfovibrio ferrireducens]MBI9112411.1 branched-chain amino acid ABC transporter permease [Maridesulfovibrio ferrireducens]SDK89396.1 branched-chain amino acid transport system permease protein [Maridesulfovibrio ferrireducens]
MQKYSFNFGIWGMALIIIALSQFGALDLYIQSVIMFIGINIILSSSLNVVNGYMGEFSCGHAGFMCVGAYVSSILSVIFFSQNAIFGAPILPPEFAIIGFPIVVIISGLVAGVTGLIVAIPSFKTRGDYLAIITIAANYMVISAIENVDVIGGSRGFMGMKRVVNAMTDVIDLPWMMIWVILGTYMSIWMIRRFVSSTYGKGIMAVSQDEVAAEIMSVNTNKMKMAAFMLSSGLAGIAGALFAHVLGYVNPQSFNIMKSTECLVMVYLGGMGSLGGSVLSAILFTVMLELLRFIIPAIDTGLHIINVLPDSYHLSQVWKWVLIPLTLILLMQFRPEGLMGNKELPKLFPGLKKFYKFK